MASPAKSKKLDAIISTASNRSLQTAKNLNRSWIPKIGVHQRALNKDSQVQSAVLVRTKMGDWDFINVNGFGQKFDEV